MLKIDASEEGCGKSIAVMFSALLKSCNCDSDPLQLMYSKDRLCTSILAFKQIKIYDSNAGWEEISTS